MEVAGVHLVQTIAHVDGPRRSAVARLDGAGRLTALVLAAGDEEVLSALPEGLAAACVDAPLAVPNARGQRDVERVLAWCDAPAFPVSRDRLERVHGGARGLALAPRLTGRGTVAEALPDLVLRQLRWERDHPPGAPAMDLGAYRAAWYAVRAPRYRDRGGGGARPAGMAEAHDLLAGALDLGGWAPGTPGAAGDWAALHDAARLDALACAVAALRLARGTGEGGAVLLGTAGRGRVAVPAGADLRGRIAVNLARLRAEGAVAI